MRERYMRMILFFDLPTTTTTELKAYIRFRKFIIKEGFSMMQESVYTKLALNPSTVALTKSKLYNNIPEKGLIQLLTVTEKQFADIVTLSGKQNKNIVDNTERLLFI